MAVPWSSVPVPSPTVCGWDRPLLPYKAHVGGLDELRHPRLTETKTPRTVHSEPDGEQTSDWHLQISKGSHDGARVPSPGGHSLPGRSRPQESAFARPALVAAYGGHRQRFVSESHPLCLIPQTQITGRSHKIVSQSEASCRTPPQTPTPPDRGRGDGRHPLQRGTRSFPAFGRAPPAVSSLSCSYSFEGVCASQVRVPWPVGHRQQLRAPGSARRAVISQGLPWSGAHAAPRSRPGTSAGGARFSES